MDSGVYAACAAFVARSQSLDSVANNLANASTAGYRAQHTRFQTVLAQMGQHPISELGEAVNSFGVLGNTRIDLSQAGLESTGNPLDFALQGPGFFVVQSPQGRFLTRDGNFHLSAQHQLVNSSGDPVMGAQGILTLPADGTINVSPDGTISVNGAAAGRLKIVELASGSDVQSVGANYYSAPSQAQLDASKTEVRQGFLESANVNPVEATVELILTQRNAEMMQRALSIFHNEFNKTATEDLPRTS